MAAAWACVLQPAVLPWPSRPRASPLTVGPPRSALAQAMSGAMFSRMDVIFRDMGVSGMPGGDRAHLCWRQSEVPWRDPVMAVC